MIRKWLQPKHKWVCHSLLKLIVLMIDEVLVNEYIYIVIG